MAALRFGEYWGSGSLFGAAPLAGGRVYWWSSSRMPETPAGDGPVEKAGLLRLHAGWARPIEELLSATPDGAVLRDPLRERPPIPRLTLGRICFVGDAAHPSLPYLGQGGCQAIEDAVELAAAMLVSTDLESALARYQERRERQVAGVVRQSRQMARLAHIRPRAAVAARDLLLRATPRRATLRRLEPLVGHRADGGRTLNPEPLLSRGEATR